MITRHVQETTAGIVYANRWSTAAHSGYSGGEVAYASTDGATATYTFTAKSVSWIGPVGATRGKARVSIDGVVVATVDTRRSSFKPRVTLFSKTWRRSGTHTITIEVVGSGRPVAIDEFLTKG